MLQTTICFLVLKNHVLLGLKKRGFGVGKWNGIGGKRDASDHTITDTARRELKEEIGVEALALTRVATLDFHFETQLDWNQTVSIFLCRDWNGDAQESEEMKPQWFWQESLPYNEMWEDDQHWLPLVLAGRRLKGAFWFNKESKIIKFEIEFLS